MFQLNKEEAESLRSQFVMLNDGSDNLKSQFATSDCAFLVLFARFIAKKCGKPQKFAVNRQIWYTRVPNCRNTVATISKGQRLVGFFLFVNLPGSYSGQFRPLIRDCIPPILHLGRIIAAVFRTIFTFFLRMSEKSCTFARNFACYIE